MERIIGIDLGTTNSCVAVYEHDQSSVLLSRTGQNTIPSVVALTEQGKRLVGHLAKRQAITNPRNTLYGAKRLIGRRWDSKDVQKAVKMVSYECVPGPHDDVRLILGDKGYAVPEVSSIVLQEMRKIAEAHLQQSVEKAVVTVPAYFNDNQRQATRDAGRIAGLDVVRIINEPTAAALAYGFGRSSNERVAVFDLGGGTFDISILEISEGVFEVLATAGDTFLGGEDFDERIIDWLAQRFYEENKIDLREDKMSLQRLRDAAENAKIELSTVDQVDVNLPFIYSQGKGDALHLQEVLTRDTLNHLVADLIERAIQICGRALDRSGLTKDKVSAVVLVGGMTRMPRIPQAVESFFGIAPSKGVHPDEVVACGAAIQGWLFTQSSNETLLLDVTPHHLGIMVAGGAFETIIERDTTIPTSARKSFTTIRDDQTQVRIMVLQGDSDRAQENELLGEFLLDGLRKAPTGEVKIEVIFEISADGIVSVSARDLETGREQQITVTASSGLTEEEIEAMARENQDFLVQSEASDAIEQERVEVDRRLRDIEKLMPEARPKLAQSEFGVDAMSKAERHLINAHRAIASKDVSALRQAREELESTLKMLEGLLSGDG